MKKLKSAEEFAHEAFVLLFKKAEKQVGPVFITDKEIKTNTGRSKLREGFKKEVRENLQNSGCVIEHRKDGMLVTPPTEFNGPIPTYSDVKKDIEDQERREAEWNRETE